MRGIYFIQIITIELPICDLNLIFLTSVTRELVLFFIQFLSFELVFRFVNALHWLFHLSQIRGDVLKVLSLLILEILLIHSVTYIVWEKWPHVETLESFENSIGLWVILVGMTLFWHSLVQFFNQVVVIVGQPDILMNIISFYIFLVRNFICSVL